MNQELDVIGEKEKALAADFLSMDPNDALLKSLWKVEAGPKSTQIEFGNLTKDTFYHSSSDSYLAGDQQKWGDVQAIGVLSAPNQEKSRSADKIILRSAEMTNRFGDKFGQISIAVLDGQTPVDALDESIRVQAELLLKQGDTPDCIVPRLAEQFPQIFDEQKDMYNIRALIYQNRGDGERLPGEGWLDRQTSPTRRSWMLLNSVLRYKLGIKQEPEVDNLPGLTGTIVDFKATTNQFEWCSIADTPVIIVDGRGRVAIVSFHPNGAFDDETVKNMRRLIKQGKAATATEAKQILKEEGYYSDSYRKKCNITVPVCNGQSGFFWQIHKASLTSSSGDLAAAIFATDGFFYYLQGLAPGKKQKELLKVVKMLLVPETRSQVLSYIERMETDTWNEKMPLRERKSDDKQVVVLNLMKKEELIQNQVLDNLRPNF